MKVMEFNQLQLHRFCAKKTDPFDMLEPMAKISNSVHRTMEERTPHPKETNQEKTIPAATLQPVSARQLKCCACGGLVLANLKRKSIEKHVHTGHEISDQKQLKLLQTPQKNTVGKKYRSSSHFHTLSIVPTFVEHFHTHSLNALRHGIEKASTNSYEPVL